MLERFLRNTSAFDGPVSLPSFPSEIIARCRVIAIHPWRNAWTPQLCAPLLKGAPATKPARPTRADRARGDDPPSPRDETASHTATAREPCGRGLAGPRSAVPWGP